MPARPTSPCLDVPRSRHADSAYSVIVLGDALLPGMPGQVAPFVLPVFAFAGGVVATVIVYRIASRDGQTDISTMLLAGIAINAVAGAGIGMFMFASTDQQLRELSFWLLGSLGGVTWSALMPGIVMAGAALVLLSCLVRPLNALPLGEADARHLGVDVERAKRLLIAGAALATGAVVSITGVIGFHLLRGGRVRGPPVVCIPHRLGNPAGVRGLDPLGGIPCRPPRCGRSPEHVPRRSALRGFRRRAAPRVRLKADCFAAAARFGGEGIPAG